MVKVAVVEVVAKRITIVEVGLADKTIIGIVIGIVLRWK